MKIALHIMNGLVILILTIVMSVEVINSFDGRLHTYNLHANMGLAVLFATCLIVVLGFIVWIAHLNMGGLFVKKAAKVLQAKALHKYLGYGLIILS